METKSIWMLVAGLVGVVAGFFVGMNFPYSSKQRAYAQKGIELLKARSRNASYTDADLKAMLEDAIKKKTA